MGSIGVFWTGSRLSGLFLMKRFFPQERWEKADLEKNVHLEGFVAFGGGKNQCPGRLEKLLCLYEIIFVYT